MSRPFDVLVHRDRTVADCEERTLTTDVYYPESSAATEIAETITSSAVRPTRPFVVYVCSGVWETGSTGQSARWASDAADGGFVAAEALYRLGHEALFPMRIEDVYEGIGWLTGRADEFGVDTGAIAVVGHSAGAHLALLAALPDDEFGRQADIDAAAGVSGVHDLRADGHEHTGESLSLFENRLSAAELRRCSPITYVNDDIDADTDAPPTLLLYGSEDLVVAPDQDIRLTDAPEGTGT